MTEHSDMLALADLRAANVTRQKEWDSLGQLTLAYRGNELAGEVGEACNVIKKLEREKLGIKGSRDTVEHLAEELADVIICTDLIAMQAGINLDAAVIAKFNTSSEKVGLATRLSATTEAAVDAKGEPVAWMIVWPDGAMSFTRRPPTAPSPKDYEYKPLYTRPAPSQSVEPAASRLGRWLAAALDDPNVCAEMKADINAWFEAGEPGQSGEAAKMREACAAVAEDAARQDEWPIAGDPQSTSPTQLMQQAIATAIRALPLPSDDGEVRS